MQNHCIEKFKTKSSNLQNQIDLADDYVVKTYKHLTDLEARKKGGNICMEMMNVKTMKKSMKKFKE